MTPPVSARLLKSSALQQQLVLPSGCGCELSWPAVPLLSDYFVLHAEVTDHPFTAAQSAELCAAGHRVARMLAQERFGDPECFTLLVNAARTRRKGWPHVHIFLAPSVLGKRRALFVASLKHVLRWRRWPLVRRLCGPSAPVEGRRALAAGNR